MRPSILFSSRHSSPSANPTLYFTEPSELTPWLELSSRDGASSSCETLAPEGASREDKSTARLSPLFVSTAADEGGLAAFLSHDSSAVRGDGSPDAEQAQEPYSEPHKRAHHSGAQSRLQPHNVALRPPVRAAVGRQALGSPLPLPPRLVGTVGPGGEWARDGGYAQSPVAGRQFPSQVQAGQGKPEARANSGQPFGPKYQPQPAPEAIHPTSSRKLHVGSRLAKH
ncbi:unnamed protein product [Protopolystoma xenopodis]|uniref:Uncharacterized protein n=1 Tax=Protopolystoma xenopodis TaxID=117903 RepID=A0A448XMP2_9PLAT|nr:unnamed protein product [Protopolystoma xenopodis]